MESAEEEFVIDTGSNASIIVTPAFAQQHELANRLGKSLVVRGRGVGGDVEMTLGRVDGLQLGDFQIKDALVLVPARGEFAQPGKAGNLGTKLLRRFRVIFNYTRQELILEPNSSFSAPYEFDMSGLVLTSGRAAPCRVDRVLSNSPASEADLQPGDRILAINDRLAGQSSLCEIRALLRQHGKECLLRVSRGGEEFLVRLKLRRLI